MTRFDDGPIEGASPELYTLLKSLNQSCTHFVIGSAIRNLSSAFIQAYEYGGDFALHTWSHPYMTSLTNEEVLAEFGWNFQIIYDLIQRVPKFWRPPYGDTDARVRAIATQVFGLTGVMWNQEYVALPLDSFLI
jgi:chitin deacetylase